MLTIRDMGGNLLFVHVGITYVITGIVVVGIWFHWCAMVHLWRQFFRSPEYAESFYAWTLIGFQVPKKLHSDKGLRAVFESMQVHAPQNPRNVTHAVNIYTYTALRTRRENFTLQVLLPIQWELFIVESYDLIKL